MLKMCDIELTRVFDKTTGLPVRGKEQEAQEATDDAWEEFFSGPVGMNLTSIWGGADKIGGPGEEPFDSIFRAIDDRMRVECGEKGQVGRHDYPGCWFLYRLEPVVAALLRIRHPLVVPQRAATIEAAEPELTEKEKFDALVKQASDDCANPNISSVEIRNRRKSDPEYDKAFIFAQQFATAAGFHETLPVNEQPEATPEIKQFAHIFKRGTQSFQPSIGRVTLTVDRGDDYNALPADKIKVYHFPQAEFETKYEAAHKSGLI